MSDEREAFRRARGQASAASAASEADDASVREAFRRARNPQMGPEGELDMGELRALGGALLSDVGEQVSQAQRLAAARERAMRDRGQVTREEWFSPEGTRGEVAAGSVRGVANTLELPAVLATGSPSPAGYALRQAPEAAAVVTDALRVPAEAVRERSYGLLPEESGAGDRFLGNVAEIALETILTAPLAGPVPRSVLNRIVPAVRARQQAMRSPEGRQRLEAAVERERVRAANRGRAPRMGEAWQREGRNLMAEAEAQATLANRTVREGRRQLRRRVGAAAFPVAGAAGGKSIAEAQDAGTLGELGSTLAGAAIGAGVRGVGGPALSGSAAVSRLFGDPGPSSVNPVTNRIITTQRQLFDREEVLSRRYRDLQAEAKRVGLQFRPDWMRNQFNNLLNDPDNPMVGEGRVVIERIARGINELGDDVPVGAFRAWQRDINEQLYNRTVKGERSYALTRASSIMRRALAEAADSAGPGSLQDDLRRTNRDWAQLQREQITAGLFEKGRKKIQGFYGRNPKATPRRFNQWFENDKQFIEDTFTDAFSDHFRNLPREAAEQRARAMARDHMDNLLRISANIDRIPPGTLLDVAGDVDDALRRATEDAVRSGVRIATAPIGSMRFRGRRLAEAISLAQSSLMDERRLIAFMGAFDDVDMARELVRAVEARALPGTIRATRDALRFSADAPGKLLEE